MWRQHPHPVRGCRDASAANTRDRATAALVDPPSRLCRVREQACSPDVSRSIASSSLSRATCHCLPGSQWLHNAGGPAVFKEGRGGLRTIAGSYTLFKNVGGQV